MREIKFKAWYKEYKVMLVVYNLAFSDEGPEPFSHDSVQVRYNGEWLWLEEDEFILIQYTDLKDKNGRGDEIYQDDIMGLYSGTKYLVYWDNEYGQWWGRPMKESKGSFARSLKELLDKFYMEIIGTIHDKEQDNG